MIMLNILFVKLAFVLLASSAGRVLCDDEFVDKNALFIDTYSKTHPDAVQLPSGLLYRVIKEGKADSPRVTADQACLVRYRGTTITGAVFTASGKQGASSSEVVPAQLTLPGWREALTLMREGDHWEAVLPAHLAYGSKSKGKLVQPDSTVIFDLQVERATAPPSKGMSLFTRQALGAAFMVAYGLYMTYQSKKQLGQAAAVPALPPKDVCGAPEHPTVFLKVAVGNTILDTVEIELFSSVCPKTVENFRCLVRIIVFYC
jgi:FKBP-type peptidyl-prolyl cis-trans isomerase FklB